MNETEISHLIEAYTRQGEHRTATDVDRTSAEWLAQEYTRRGITPSLQEFIVDRLDVLSAKVQWEGQSVPGIPLYDCQYTSVLGVEGLLVEAGAEGDFCLTHVPPNDGAPEVTRLKKLREAGQYKAIIAISSTSGPPSHPALLNAERFRDPFGVPVLQIAVQYENALRSTIQSRVPIRFFAHCERVATEAYNVVGRQPGTDGALAPVVVMTPRSGWWRCASERGGGIVSLLDMMETLSRVNAKREVVFAATTGHELSHLGLDHFLEQNSSLVQTAKAWIHLGANFAAVNGSTVMQFSDADLLQLTESILEQNGIVPDRVVPVGQRPGGEARNIFDGGGRYISLLGGNPLFHHPADVWPTAVDVPKTAGWINVMNQLLEALSTE